MLVAAMLSKSYTYCFNKIVVSCAAMLSNNYKYCFNKNVVSRAGW